ncbi:MAG: hypothetical protein FWE55_01710 [Synergistaceae bacterium]|nr:hypothetical protein [Synergistaceae bacterium]
MAGTDNPRRYWSDLKRKLKAEGNQLYENIVQLKMKSADGKNYNTDAANTKGILRIIQSIPSPKAEPITKPSMPIDIIHPKNYTTSRQGRNNKTFTQQE